MNPTVVCPTTRKQFKQHATVLEDWLTANHNVYPSKEQKLQLATVAAMSEHQVNRWFANRRRKMKTVDGSVPKESHHTSIATTDDQLLKEKSGEAEEKSSAADIPQSDLQDWKFPASTDPNNNPQKSGSPDLLLKEQLEKTLLETYLRNAFLAQLLVPQIPLDSHGPNPLLFPSWPYQLQLNPYANLPFAQHLAFGQPQLQPPQRFTQNELGRMSRPTDCCDLPYNSNDSESADQKRSETPQLRTIESEKESDLLTKETIAVAVLASFALQKKSLDNYDSTTV